MGPLKNTKHEAFVLAVFNGIKPREAYGQVFPTCADSALDACASRLLRSAKVSARLAELQSKVAAKVETKVALTKQWVIDNVQRLAGVAEAAGNHAVAKGCFELLGREVNAFTEKRNLTVRSIADLSQEELQDELARLESGNQGAGNSGLAGGTRQAPKREKAARGAGRVLN